MQFCLLQVSLFPNCHVNDIYSLCFTKKKCVLTEKSTIIENSYLCCTIQSQCKYFTLDLVIMLGAYYCNYEKSSFSKYFQYAIVFMIPKYYIQATYPLNAKPLLKVIVGIMFSQDKFFAILNSQLCKLILVNYGATEYVCTVCSA